MTVARLCKSDTAREAALHAGLLDALYGSVGGDWQGFLDAMSRAYGGAMVTLGMRDHVLGCAWSKATSDRDPAAIARYDRYYAQVDDWAPASLSYPVGEVAVSDELVAPQVFQRGEFYADWCRPLGIDVGLCSLLQRDGSRLLGVAVLLPRAALVADRQAVARLQRLAPHLQRAAQLERQLGDRDQRIAAAEGALGDLGVASLLCDAQARPLAPNAAAEALLAVGDGMILAHRRLDAVVAAEGRALRALIHAAASARGGSADAPGGLMRISRRGGGVAYEVLVTPAPEGAPRAMVFVRDPAARPRAPAEALRGLYRLSAAEARLLQTLLGGASLDEAAAAHGLGRETLRSQLRSLFRKLDVSSQRELVLRCTNTLAGLWRD